MKRPAGLTLGQRVVLLFGVVGVVLLAQAGGAAWLAAKSRSDLDSLVNTINPVRNAAEQLMSVLLDQETGVRGYAVSGDAADLGPYRKGLDRQRELVAKIDRGLTVAPELRGQLATVAQRADNWRATVAEPIIDTVRSRGAAAARGLVNDAARESFDSVRAAVEQLREELRKLRDRVAAHARTTSDRLVLMLVGAAIVILIAGVAVGVLLRQLVTKPVGLLAADVREVAGGNYEHGIASLGVPELRRLASDVDAMRRKIATDLAEVREARGQVQWVNDQLQAQAEELTRSNRDLEQFAYVASHDLQEPLRKVASFCQLLQRRYAGQLDERADQYIAFAVDGAQRMQRLINDLLAFSRIGRLTAGFTDIDLNAVMADVASQLDASREYVHGEITWDDLPVIEGEEPLLANLFTNLVANSLKFHRPGVTPRVHVSARQLDSEWEISVSDNGIGIEKEFADKIFVIFQRLHAKDAYPGTGIGLAIVKKIIEYHGGRVWLDPEASEGTTIRFTLPGAPVPPTGSAAVAQRRDDADEAAPAAKETVA